MTVLLGALEVARLGVIIKDIDTASSSITKPDADVESTGLPAATDNIAAVPIITYFGLWSAYGLAENAG